jgi:ribosomal protein S27AE
MSTKAQTARSLANSHFKNLGIAKMPCERCGVETSLKHHDDYERPLDVMWLCGKHHHERHKELGWGSSKTGPSIHSKSETDNRPRIRIRPELVELAKLNRRSITKEIETAIDRHLLENAMYLKKGPKLRTP